MIQVQKPWSVDFVEALNELQTGKRYGHPYTCEHRGDGKHEHNGNDLGCLTPTTDGWLCPSCNYTQDWAWSVVGLVNPFEAEK